MSLSLCAGFSCLKEDTAEVIGLLGEVVTDPLFPPDKIELLKAQASVPSSSLPSPGLSGLVLVKAAPQLLEC